MKKFHVEKLLKPKRRQNYLEFSSVFAEFSNNDVLNCEKSVEVGEKRIIFAKLKDTSGKSLQFKDLYLLRAPKFEKWIGKLLKNLIPGKAFGLLIFAN